MLMIAFCAFAALRCWTVDYYSKRTVSFLVVKELRDCQYTFLSSVDKKSCLFLCWSERERICYDHVCLLLFFHFAICLSASLSIADYSLSWKTTVF